MQTEREIERETNRPTERKREKLKYIVGGRVRSKKIDTDKQRREKES